MFIWDALIVGLVLLTLALAVTGLMHLRARVPFVPTPHAVARRMVALADLRAGDRVVDLGAGDARLLLLAERAEPGIVCIGYELQPLVWLAGKLRIAFARSRVQLRLQDAFSADLRGVDCVLLYLSGGMLAQLEEKFTAELRPGTRIVSYAFALPDRVPEHEEDVPWLTGTRKLRVYRW